MKTPIRIQTRAAPYATVAFATLVFTPAPAAMRESWPQRLEADWLLAEEVAQVSKPAVSQISKSAFAANASGARKFPSPTGLETGDTADSEVCATTLGAFKHELE